MPKDIGITVREALQLKPLKNVKVVAGQKGLDKNIKYINVMEVPDILDWVKEGELLLTTTYSMKDDLEALNNLIPRLAKSNLAGLGIKPGRYIEEIPENMIEQANELGFPLLELPYEVSFSELMEPVLSEILNEQANFLKMSLDMHNYLMEVVLDGGGLSEIADTLARLIKYPVAIVDPRFKVLAFASGDISEIEVDLFVGSGDDQHASDYLAEELIRKDSIVGRFKRTKVEIDEKEIYQMSIPIVGGGKLRGHLFVWELNEELKRADLMAIERSSTVAALEIINQQAIFEVERKYHNELLYEIISGRFDSEATIIERAHSIGWHLDKTYSLLLFDLTDGQKNSNNDQKKFQELKSNLLSELNLYLKSNYPEVILGDRGSNIILMYPIESLLEKELSEEAIKDRIRKFAKKLLKISQRVVKHDIIVGISNYYESIEKIQDSYEEANSALQVANVIKQEDDNIIFFEDLGVYRLLYNLDLSEIDSFLQDTILPLMQYDKKHNTEFVKTLEQYFICNGNLKKMADNLFLHYNSVLYRVERIQEIMDIDLNNHEQRLSLEVGLKLLDFNKDNL
ncbi:PucR family transcriptional regulator ligand-binding domain-containing protein [Candidatus Frackibacter sp. WG13]|uniref:PucR family transcriptional regulator ligand-binding domain-containing protein n=1 Tax=Candidatus Frackibacter sp. WG13 TaxID=2017978 RepID=UPI0008F40005|nr:PucR family transcriptional regulator ligand-binding domain-containing protein [Candidatus Frackibacter sp. WG13]SFM01455.1 transcriptional regulator, CdaR family [Candidatus Frackibacter sp. WG13]